MLEASGLSASALGVDDSRGQVTVYSALAVCPNTKS